jgi:hypothetical protein
MKNSKMKVASLSIIASLNAFVTNASEVIVVDNNINPSINLTKNQKPNVYSIWELYDLEVGKNQQERNKVANEIRTNFGTYISKHLDIPVSERECLDTEWKKNKELVSIVDGFASGIENGHRLGVLIVNGEKLSVINEIAKEQNVSFSVNDELNLLGEENLHHYSTVPLRDGKGKVGTKREVGTGKLYVYAEVSFRLWF